MLTVIITPSQKYFVTVHSVDFAVHLFSIYIGKQYYQILILLFRIHLSNNKAF